MISKSLRQVFVKQAKMPSQTLLVSTPLRAAGGGAKKPNMPADVTDFDVVFVGKCVVIIDMLL
jgi:hypothetical protein